MNMATIRRIPATASGPHPVSKVESVTPAMAEAWLKTMTANRPISQKNVIEFAMAMVENRWSLNGETIKFNEKQQLFDGQNRLQACLLAGVPFRTHVIRGIDDPAAFSTVDTGKARSNSDIFAIAGWQNNKTASGAAYILYAYEHKRIAWSGVTGEYSKGKGHIAERLKRGAALTTIPRDELIRWAQANEEKLTQAVRFANSAKASHIMPSSSVAALYFIFRDRAVHAAEQFFVDLGEGVNLNKGDPVWVLREKLLAAKGSKTQKLARFVILGLSIKAWNKRRDNDTTKVLGVQSGEVFPHAK